MPYRNVRPIISEKLILAFSCVVLAACTAGPHSDRAVARDSAGIRIVESQGPSWSDIDQWQVDTTPLLSIGVEAGEEEYTLSLVRSVLRLDDGRIVVGDGGSRQVRFYDSTGRFVTAAGGPGQGPGEFGSWVLRMWRKPPNEIWVNDEANGRINVIDTEGTFRRSVRLLPPPVAPRATAIGLFGDGSILSTGAVGGAMTESTGRPGDVRRVESVYLRHGAGGEYVGEVLRYRHRPEYAHVFLGSTTFSPIPFTQGAFGTVVGNALAVYRGSGSEIEVWAQDGRLQRIIRWREAHPRPVRDVWERYNIASLDRAGMTPLGRQLYRDFHELALPLPEHLPALDAIMSDSERRIWARRYRLPWEPDQRWEVFAEDGHWLGAITTPRGLTVYNIGTDFVLGVHRDELDVERVRLYALKKR